MCITQWLDRDWNKSKKKKKKSANDKNATLDGPQTILLAAMFECMMAKGKSLCFGSNILPLAHINDLYHDVISNMMEKDIDYI